MSFFGISFFKGRSLAGISRKPPLMHPLNAPVTMRKAPFDFEMYKYVGPAIERIVTENGTRRPALVAQMVREVTSGEAQVWEEMTASVRDVLKNGHPQAKMIEDALVGYYATKIPVDQQEERPHAASKKAKDAHHDIGFSLFTKLNGPKVRETA